MYLFRVGLISFSIVLNFSNAIKFTHEGKVGINLHIAPEQHSEHAERHLSAISEKEIAEESTSAASQSNCCRETRHRQSSKEELHQHGAPSDGPGTPIKIPGSMDEEIEKNHHSRETVVWLCCDVYDTGIGIPGIFSF